MDPIYTQVTILLSNTYRIKSLFKHCLRSWALIAILACVRLPAAHADPTPVRHVQGTIHGFLELRAGDGRVVASGDVLQVPHGDRVTTQTFFKFKDGSTDDETTVYSQHHIFQLITDHHIQKGPSFPHPMDVTIDARGGQVTVRSTGKDGKEEVKNDHMKLPPDLANGLVPLVVENMLADAPATTVSLLVADPKPRIVKLVFSKVGEDDFSVGESPRKAIHYEIKIDLGGVAGVVAPLIGKQPPNIQIWTVGGEAPVFVKELGPLYPDGPMMTIQLANPVWPESQNTGHN
ncbi:MAG: hypothetical protein WAL75_04385 [Terracidiphilus sp.]